VTFPAYEYDCRIEGALRVFCAAPGLAGFSILDIRKENERERSFSSARKGTEKGCACRRESSNIKLKQKCCSPLPGRPAKLALLCASAQRKTAGQTEKQTRLFFG